MNKVTAITGSTGGIAQEMVKLLASQNHDLILLNRNIDKTNKQIAELKQINPNINITYHHADMSDINSVKEVISYLKDIHIDYLILNSAIYNVEVKQLNSGYNNIFTVNFISPFLIIKELKEKLDIEKFIVVGSLSYNFSKYISDDVDYSNHNKINKIYGNSKRFLMFSLFKEFEHDQRLVIVHPGIVYTQMTNHYPKWINWFIAGGLQILLPNTKHAAKVLLEGFNKETKYLEWIGPRLFHLYGKGSIHKIKNIKEKEINNIYQESINIYNKLK